MDVASGLPHRGGIKDYAPDGSWLQERKLENFYSERLSILREERVHTKCVIVCASFSLHCLSMLMCGFLQILFVHQLLFFYGFSFYLACLYFFSLCLQVILLGIVAADF